MKPDTKIAAHLALLAVAIIYGINYSVAKDVMPEYVQPLGFILIRAIGGTVLFWITALFLGWEKVKAKDLGRLALSGFFGVALNQMAFFEGLNATTPINAAIMMTINPIIVLMLSAILLKEKLRLSRIIGIGLGIVGALFLITHGATSLHVFSSKDSFGNILVLLNAASYAAYLVVVKPLMKKYKPITVIRWVFLFGLIMVIPFGYKQIGEVVWNSFPSFIWWEIGFVVLCTTYLAYLLNIFALKTVTSTTVSFYIYLQPLIATITAVLMGKDHLNVTLIISALLLFSGVYLVSFYKR
jgi:drug/metabolite transporter (DMT)-like permease